MRMRVHSFAAVLVAALLCALGVTGCASIAPPQLSVTLTRVQLADASVLEQRLKLSLRFVNSSQRDIAVRGLNYTLDINGREFASGTSDTTFTVPQFGETTIEVNAVSSLSGVLRQLRETQGPSRGATTIPPALSYRIRGHANAGAFGLAFDTESELPFPVLPD
jgi:LEA14-like dessication related protein